MKKLFTILFLVFCISNVNSQSEVIKLPKFLSYITKTIDTLNYYKNGGTLKGNVREVTKYLKSYRVTSKYFNQKNEPISAFGKRLYTIKNKNKSVKEIYFLDTNPRAGNSYRKRDENNYYLGEVVTYNSDNTIQSFKKINDDLSEIHFYYTYGKFNQLLSITEKVFLSAEIPSNDGTTIAEINVETEPTYTKTTRPVYEGDRLMSLTTILNDEYNDYLEHTVQNFNYYSKEKVRGVLQEVYRTTKKTGKKIGFTERKHLILLYFPNNSLKETILNYKNEQEGNVTVKTNYRQIKSAPFEIIRITTSVELDEKMDVLTQNIEIKRDKSQNIIEVKNNTNQNWNEKITFRYKYY